jgi:hypothetical protein
MLMDIDQLPDCAGSHLSFCALIRGQSPQPLRCGENRFFRTLTFTALCMCQFYDGSNWGERRISPEGD